MHVARHKLGALRLFSWFQERIVIQHSINLLKGDEKQKKVAEVYESVFRDLAMWIAWRD